MKWPRSVLLGALLLGNKLTSVLPQNMTVARRWYSVRHWDPQISAWLPKGREEAVWIPYCFTTEADYDNLNPIVEAAIKIWEPAMAVSSLNFVPFFAPGIKTICSEPGVPLWAVHIKQIPDGFGGASSSWGFHTYTAAQLHEAGLEYPHFLHFAPAARYARTMHPFQPKEKQHEVPGELYLRLGEMVDLLPNEPSRREGWMTGATYTGTWREKTGIFPIRNVEELPYRHDYNVNIMAHELGHIAGLLNEHQRPDARQSIRYDCTRFPDFDRVKDAIRRKDAAHGWQEGDTIEIACTDIEVAARYEQYFPRFPVHAYALHRPDERVDSIGPLLKSREIDFDSIMLYASYEPVGSYRLSRKSFKRVFPESAVVWKIDASVPGGKVELLPGGVRVDKQTRGYDYSETRISEGDVARIVQLYPRKMKEGEGQGQGQEVAGRAEWQDDTKEKKR